MAVLILEAKFIFKGNKNKLIISFASVEQGCLCCFCKMSLINGRHFVGGFLGNMLRLSKDINY